MIGYFLRNATGFFIQLFPCALMIFLPFSQESLRFPRKWIFTGVALTTAAMALLFPGVLCGLGGTAPEGGGVANLLMLLAILLVLAAYIWLVQEMVLKKIMAFFTVLFYAAAQYWLVGMVAPLLYSYQGEYITIEYIAAYTTIDVLLYVVATVLLLPLYLAVVICPQKVFNREIDPKTMRREFTVTTISSTLCFALMFYCDTVWRSTLAVSTVHLRWLVPLFFFLIANQGTIYWLVFRESVRRKRDEDYRRAIEINQIQHNKIISDMENTRRMRHDMRHHYNFLYGMLAQGHAGEAKEYLSRLIGSTEGENKSYCQNMAVNGLLQYYAGLARDEDIHCRIEADCGELVIPSEDLTVLFGNAMENAIHACQRYPQNRWICVQMGTIQGSLVISITNPCREVYLQPRYQAEKGFLPAEAFLSGRRGGGYGLRSLAHTAQTYGGDAQFRFDAGAEVFTARIRLDLHEEML